MIDAAWLLLHLAYVLPLALLAWVVAGRETSHTRATLLALLALPFLYLSHYLVTGSLAGLPSDRPVPDSFTLLGYEVSEPDGKKGDAGEILMWVRGEGNTSPRVHRLPYARDLHEALRDAGERSAAGTTQVGLRRKVEQAGGAEHAQSHGGVLEFRDKDPVKPPAKDEA